jgi:hypothetical protein
VRVPGNLLNAWRMSKAMGQRPSAVYQIEERYGSYAAYCFDAAVVAWGTAFDAAVENSSSEAKSKDAARLAQHRVIRSWLGAEATGGYRDPAKR